MLIEFTTISLRMVRVLSGSGRKGRGMMVLNQRWCPFGDTGADDLQIMMQCEGCPLSWRDIDCVKVFDPKRVLHGDLLMLCNDLLMLMRRGKRSHLRRWHQALGLLAFSDRLLLYLQGGTSALMYKW